MNSIPNEIMLNVIAFLDISDVVRLQEVSRRFNKVARDNNLWKSLCWEQSSSKLLQRRQLTYLDMSSSLQSLAVAVNDLQESQSGTSESSPRNQLRNASSRRQINIANWDPVYYGEKVDFYQEFIHRHAQISISWFSQTEQGPKRKCQLNEALGMALCGQQGESFSERIVAPMEDGSICIWRVPRSCESTFPYYPELLGKSRSGLLLDFDHGFDDKGVTRLSGAAMTDAGAVDCIAVDNRSQKAFIGVGNVLNEVDLNTLQVSGQSTYPFPITAISEAKTPVPLTIGTSWTIHLHDNRLRNTNNSTSLVIPDKLETSRSMESSKLSDDYHASLSQPGALSIVHTPPGSAATEDGDIWVAGRFTSILNYDRRYFPRLRSTVHSGARLSCMAVIPYPYIPRDENNADTSLNEDTIRKIRSSTGRTIVAAGEYKGKGSLELYEVLPDTSILSHNPALGNTRQNYKNRQSASSSRLLSVTSHGTRIVYTDGNGNIKWVERDGFTPVRQFNINTSPNLTVTSIATSEGGAMQANAENIGAKGDIVQKILPQVSPQATGTGGVPLGDENLFLWTGDGKLGVLRFGNEIAKSTRNLEENVQDAEALMQHRRERAYDNEMRLALEQHAAEIRFVRGWGIGT